MNNQHWDELIWFQVSELLKQRFDRACTKAGLSKEQWFETVLAEFEIKLRKTVMDDEESLAAK